MGKPKIRFKGFTEEWEQRKLGETLYSLRNNTLSRAELSLENGVAKNVHYGDILVKFGEILDVKKELLPMIVDELVLAKYRDSFLQNGDIVIADTAEDETVGKCSEIAGVSDEKIIAGLHTIPCRPLFNFASGYLGYYLNSDDYHRQLLPLMQGIKVTSISKSALQDTKIQYPKSLEEQEQIGTYLRWLGHLITLHQRKCDETKKLKKYMLQKMFPQNGMKVPEIRFEGFTGDWEQRKLGEIVERITRKNQDLVSTLPLTISAQYGLIDQNEFFDKRVASKDVSGYYLVKKGEFAYNKSTSSDAPWGAVKRLDRYENGVLSTLYIVFAINENAEIDSDYLVTYYDTDLWHRGIREIASEGARNHGLLNIAPADFFETSLSVPQDIEEQKAIGKYFTELNALITLHQRKRDELVKIKKYMLQNMFV
jgi:restriction endonuclease S subunit